MLLRGGTLLAALFSSGAPVSAGEADIQLPLLDQVDFFHHTVTSRAILFFGLFVCAVGAAFGLWEYFRTRALPVHHRASCPWRRPESAP